MKYRTFLILALLGFLGKGETIAQEITFSRETFQAGNMTLPYRKATIPGFGDKTSIVIYLHGGTSKGNDNETQMQEPGVTSISSWLRDNNRKSIMLVPQCPKDKSWLGVTQDALVSLIRTFIDRGVADASKVYILGGSMGGTGTWNMLSNHPELFAAAMPVAGNPTGLDAENISKTPVFTVMGTADNIMKISNVEEFLTAMDAYNAEYNFDTEEGWTHEDVCKKSYTDERLDWVFSHSKEPATGIADIGNTDNKTISTTWYSANGRKLESEPSQRGVYIKKCVYDNGRSSSGKYYRN